MRCGALLVSRALGKWGLMVSVGSGQCWGHRKRLAEVGVSAELRLSAPPQLSEARGLCRMGSGHLVPKGHWCLQPQLGFSKQPGGGQLFAASLTTLPTPPEKKSPPLQAAICFFCWPRNLLKCISMDGGRQSGRTEPGRLHGEWKIVFLGGLFWSLKP